MLCGGMYRSASTWQYNVAGRLVEQYHAGKRRGYCFSGSEIAAGAHVPGCPDSWGVLKAHEADRVYAGLLARGEALALYAFRDLRDVAYSLIHKANSTFAATIESTPILGQAIANFRFWTSQPRTLVQRYEQIVAQPAASVRAIAAHLGIVLTLGESERIAGEFTLEKNRERAEQVARQYRSLGVDLDDPANALCRDELSQWHWNHIRDGRIGSWRQVATPRELAALAHQCGRWLIEQGYEHDYSWARDAFDYLLFEDFERHQAALALARRECEQSRQEAHNAGLQLQAAHRRTADLAARLHELERLGPGALRLARVFHRTAGAAIRTFAPGSREPWPA